MHVGAGCFANRASTFFGDGSVPDDADMADPRHLPTDLPGSADEAIAFLERTYRQWHTGISSLDEEGLRTPLGRKGGRYAKDPTAACSPRPDRAAGRAAGYRADGRALTQVRSSVR